MNPIIATNDVEQKIFSIRGQRVMVDRDLAVMYQVPTRVLNQAVKRNIVRFPDGFMFRLSQSELNELITNCDRFAPLKHSSHTPLVFTDYGVAMLSSVLNSKRAIKVNIEIIRVFIKLRNLFSNREILARALDQLEKRVGVHDSQIRAIFGAIRRLTELPTKKETSIGFKIL